MKSIVIFQNKDIHQFFIPPLNGDFQQPQKSLQHLTPNPFDCSELYLETLRFYSFNPRGIAQSGENCCATLFHDFLLIHEFTEW